MLAASAPHPTNCLCSSHGEQVHGNDTSLVHNLVSEDGHLHMAMAAFGGQFTEGREQHADPPCICLLTCLFAQHCGRKRGACRHSNQARYAGRAASSLQQSVLKVTARQMRAEERWRAPRARAPVHQLEERAALPCCPWPARHLMAPHPPPSTAPPGPGHTPARQPLQAGPEHSRAAQAHARRPAKKAVEGKEGPLCQACLSSKQQRAMCHPASGLESRVCMQNLKVSLLRLKSIHYTVTGLCARMLRFPGASNPREASARSQS